jgi:MFS superfamily sulfate permease-like transporter
MLLIRRVILQLNPGFIKRHKIFYKDKELAVPDGVDIFDLGKPPSIGNLYSYVEVIRNIAIPPRIMIIRFNNKFRITQSELDILNKIIKRLGLQKILIVFSDVNVNMQNHFRQTGIAEKIGEENIFYFIIDALEHTKNVLRSNMFSS